MLKRFMNWLLNRWQGLFGALSGKRKGSVNSQLGSQSVRDRADQPSAPNYAPTSSEVAIPVAERTPLTALSAPVFEPSIFEPSAAPVVEPAAPAQSAAKPSTIVKPDTHRRLDATTALPIIDTVQPTFPTEVSALMGSPMELGDNPSADPLPLRTLKKVSDAQLPDIHDLLPATEAVEPEDLPTEQPSVVTDSIVTDTLADEVPLSDRSDVIDLIERSARAQAVVKPGSASGSTSGSTITEAASEAASPQAVLFSFDIVESDRPESDSAASGEPEDLPNPLIESDLDEGVESAEEESIGDEAWVVSVPQSAQVESVFDLLPATHSSVVNESVVSESVANPPVVSSEENADLERLESIQEASENQDAQLDIEELLPAETNLYETQPISQADSVWPSVDKSVDSSVDKSADELTYEPADSALLAKAETLPYPWSLPLPDSALQTPPIEPETTSLDRTAPASSISENLSKNPTSQRELQPLTSFSSTAESAEPTESTEAEHTVRNGTVKLLFTLKEGNFHGYIAPDDGTQDILFHQKYINADVISDLDRGMKVSVSVKYVEGKAYATNVTLL
jgi:cold shock CspA family protein